MICAPADISYNSPTLRISSTCGHKSSLVRLNMSTWFCMRRSWHRFNAADLFMRVRRNWRVLLRHLVQSGNQVFQGWTLVDVVDVDVANDSVFIDHEECSLGCSIAAQHAVFAGTLPMGIKIR